MATTAVAPANTSSILSLTINKRKYNLREGDFDPKMFGVALLSKAKRANERNIFPCVLQDLARISSLPWLHWNETRSRNASGCVSVYKHNWNMSQPIHAQGAGKAVAEHVQSRFQVTDKQ